MSGIWLKHHRQISFFCGVWAKFQIPLSAEGCLWLTPQHLFINWKICGIWVVISVGEWCYVPNHFQEWVRGTKLEENQAMLERLNFWKFSTRQSWGLVQSESSAMLSSFDGKAHSQQRCCWMKPLEYSALLNSRLLPRVASVNKLGAYILLIL